MEGGGVEGALDRVLSWNLEEGPSGTSGDGRQSGLRQVGLDTASLLAVGMDEGGADRLQRYIFVHAHSLQSVISDALGVLEKKRETALRVAIAVHHVVSNLLRGANESIGYDQDCHALIPEHVEGRDQARIALLMRCQALEVDVQSWRTRHREEQTKATALQHRLQESADALRREELAREDCRIRLEDKELECRKHVASLERVHQTKACLEEQRMQLHSRCSRLDASNRQMKEESLSTNSVLRGIVSSLRSLLSVLTFRLSEDTNLQASRSDSKTECNGSPPGIPLLNGLVRLEMRVADFSFVLGVLHRRFHECCRQLHDFRKENVELKGQLRGLKVERERLVIELETKNEKYTHTLKELENSNSARDSTVVKCGALEMRVRELELKNHGFANEHIHMKKESQSLRKELDRKESHVENLRKSNAGLSKLCEDQQRRIKSATQSLEESQAQARANEKYCERLAEKVDRFLRNLQEGNAKIKVFRENKEWMQAQIDKQFDLVARTQDKVSNLKTMLEEEEYMRECTNLELKQATDAMTKAREEYELEVRRLKSEMEKHQFQAKEAQERLLACSESARELSALKGRHHKLLQDFGKLSDRIEASNTLLRRLHILASEIKSTLSGACDSPSAIQEDASENIADLEKVLCSGLDAAKHCSLNASASTAELQQAKVRMDVLSREKMELSSSVRRLHAAVESEIRARRFRERFASRLHADLQDAKRELHNLKHGYGACARHAQQQTRVA